MRAIERLARVTLMLACLGAAMLQAQDPATPGAPADAAPAGTADGGATPAPEPPPAPPTPPPGPDPERVRAELDARALRLGAERRMLHFKDNEFAVFVRKLTAGEMQGTVILVPSTAESALAADGLHQLRAALPAHGWTTWLVDMPEPPAVRTASLGALPATGGEGGGVAPGGDGADGSDKADGSGKDAAKPAGDAQAGKGSEDAPAADAAEPATAAAGAGNTEVPAMPANDPDKEQAEAIARWRGDGAERLANTINSARSEGPVVLVTEGRSAELAMTLASNPALGQALLGIVAIEPLRGSATNPGWPQDLATPVFELLSPAADRAWGDEDRGEAFARKLVDFRLDRVTIAGWEPGRAEAPASRRIRGWLARVRQQAVAGEQGRKPAAGESPVVAN